MCLISCSVFHSILSNCIFDQIFINWCFNSINKNTSLLWNKQKNMEVQSVDPEGSIRLLITNNADDNEKLSEHLLLLPMFLLSKCSRPHLRAKTISKKNVIYMMLIHKNHLLTVLESQVRNCLIRICVIRSFLKLQSILLVLFVYFCTVI